MYDIQTEPNVRQIFYNSIYESNDIKELSNDCLKLGCNHLCLYSNPVIN